MRKVMFALAMAAVLPMATAASAVSYDIFADYGTSQFSYGYGNYATTPLPTFTAYPNSYSNCFGVTGFDCQTSGPSGSTPGSSNVPGSGVGIAPMHFITVDVPQDTLWAHPGNGFTDNSAVIRFTALNAGVYQLGGLFSRLDNATSDGGGNNGVNVSIYATINGITSSIFNSTALAGSGLVQNTAVNYSLTQALGANDVISYVIQNNGTYGSDSTGLTGTITAVPEPATWAMMVGGFGMLGFGVRATRRKATFA